MKRPSRCNPAANSDRAAHRAAEVLNAPAGGVTTARDHPTAARHRAARRSPVHVAATLASQRSPVLHRPGWTSWVRDPSGPRAHRGHGGGGHPRSADPGRRRAGGAGQRRQPRRAGRAAEPRWWRSTARAASAAYVGRDLLRRHRIDRAAEAQRQAGSAFKPFVYLTAMDAGHTPSEPVVDEPITIGDWSPKNYTGRYLGPITLGECARPDRSTRWPRGIANEVGTNNVRRHHPPAGHHLADPDRSLDGAWRGGGLAAGDGRGLRRLRQRRLSRPSLRHRAHPHRQGPGALRPLGRRDPAAAGGRPAVAVGDDPDAAPGGGVRHQPRRRAHIGGYDLAGKTGTTTNDYVDAWFVGFTGGFVTAVWVGRDDNTPMKRVTGGGAPAEIWRAFMAPVLPRPLQAQAIPGGAPPAPPRNDRCDRQHPAGQRPPPPSAGKPGPGQEAPRRRRSHSTAQACRDRAVLT